MRLLGPSILVDEIGKPPKRELGDTRSRNEDRY
jgi:hypothetical protein